mmetsp:Transcript_3274/g.7747  ORF Transcript_3274/g.7747 Transcript_3274/m.7747 type:complete len:202 (-) Transcript_3274:135-740(-)
MEMPTSSTNMRSHANLKVFAPSSTPSTMCWTSEGSASIRSSVVSDCGMQDHTELLVECIFDLVQVEDPRTRDIQLVTAAVNLLIRACPCMEDVCTTLAHASAYFPDYLVRKGNSSDNGEVGNVLALLLFIAHSWCNDDVVGLKVWHKKVFRKHCSLRTLNLAVVSLLKAQNYVLRLDDLDLTIRRVALLNCIPQVSRSLSL